MNVPCKRVHLLDSDLDIFCSVQMGYKIYHPGSRSSDNFAAVLAQYWLVGWLCLTSHRQRGHLEMAPSFTGPCKGREAR